MNSDDDRRQLPQLDAECWQCGGSGKYVTADCDICYGTGYQPTRAGIDLLNFLRRQQRRIERTK
jgi:RecJ-like exonuclease